MGSGAGINFRLRGENGFKRNSPGGGGGQGFSVAAGVKALSPGSAAALFFLSDQPRLQPSTAPHLVEAFLKAQAGPEPEKRIIFPTFGGKRGNPVIFGKFHFPALSALQG